MSASWILLAAFFPTLSDAACDPRLTGTNAAKVWFKEQPTTNGAPAFIPANPIKAYFGVLVEKYETCQKEALRDEEKLCTCAVTYLADVDSCHEDWMTPWVWTVKRDHNQYCWTWQSSSGDSGSASSGYTFGSSSEMSDDSSGGSDFSGSFDESSYSSGNIKPGQWVLIAFLIICLCGCLIGLLCAFKHRKKLGKARKTAQGYDDEEGGYAEETY